MFSTVKVLHPDRVRRIGTGMGDCWLSPNGRVPNACIQCNYVCLAILLDSVLQYCSVVVLAWCPSSSGIGIPLNRVMLQG